MRNSIKKIISVCVAAATVLSMSLTAFAADYASNPSYPTSVPEVSNNVEGAPAASVADAVNAVSTESGEATVNVDTLAKVNVSASTLKKMVKNGTTLKIASKQAELSIEPSTVKRVGKLDLSAKISNSAKKSRIKFKSKKDFGCEVKVAFTGCKMSAEKLAKAHVYCDGQDLGPVELNEDGVPVITVTKGGTYEIR